MIINQAALKRQSTVLVLFIFIVLAGAYSYLELPRESSPDITIPYVFVTTTYEGVAPEDIETLITIPLERKLKGVDDLDELSSQSADGLSSIAVKFLPGTDIDDALQKVRDKVDVVLPDLPADLEDDPVVSEANFSDIPILHIVLSGPFSLKRLKSFAEDLEDRVEGISGVLDAEIIGGLEREIHVEFDLERVASYNMPLSTLLSAVDSSNVNMPGGTMDIGDAKYQVRVPEDFEHPDEINSIVAFVNNGKPVYLRDVARIRDANKDPDTISRMNGAQAVTLTVTKRSGENIIRIVDEIGVIVKEMRQSFPEELNISLTADMAKDIRLMVKDLENNIISGLLLVLVVVLAFIGGRSAVFVAQAIPVSMLITFIVLEAMGITLNMVVLFSLTLALGMLVDNGIVIVENIYRHMQEGKSRLEAARAATDEVAWPVISSTLTTVGAFFPLTFWPGIMGEFMVYLPITVIIALSASLFVALVINPVLSARFQTVKPMKTNGDDTLPDSRPLRVYRRILDWSLNHRIIVVGAAFAMLVASGWAFGTFGKGVEFFPDVDPKRSYVRVKAPVGTNLKATDRLVRQVEDVVSGYPDIRYVISSTGSMGGSGLAGGGTATHLAEVTLDFVDLFDRSRPSTEIMAEIRGKLLKTIKGAEVRVEKEEEGPPTGAAVNMEIYGEDIHQLGETAYRVRKLIEDIPGLVDLKDSYVAGKPQIRIDVDKEKAALLGLDTFVIANTIKSAINGAKVGVYREGKDEYDIIAKLPEKDRNSVESIRRITVPGTTGEAVPLTSLATVRVTSGLGDIKRIDQRRVVAVSADVNGVLANDVIKEIERRLADFTWPRGMSYAFTGEQEEQAKAQAFLSKAFISTIFIIFLVLVTQFNSFVTPFIILTSVLLSLIGVFLGLLVTHTAFGVIMTGVGVISLAGVVVNNAIVLIDYFNQLKERGYQAREALIRTGILRFRPVMLTAITTVLGLLPMATGVSFNFVDMRWDVGGESSQWWGPMAVAVIFGLGVATILTLVVVPVLCLTADNASTWFAGRKERKQAKRQAKAERKAAKKAGKNRRKDQPAPATAKPGAEPGEPPA